MHDMWYCILYSTNIACSL